MIRAENREKRWQSLEGKSIEAFEGCATLAKRERRKSVIAQDFLSFVSKSVSLLNHVNIFHPLMWIDFSDANSSTMHSQADSSLSKAFTEVSSLILYFQK